MTPLIQFATKGWQREIHFHAGAMAASSSEYELVVQKPKSALAVVCSSAIAENREMQERIDRQALVRALASAGPG